MSERKKLQPVQAVKKENYRILFTRLKVKRNLYFLYNNSSSITFLLFIPSPWR